MNTRTATALRGSATATLLAFAASGCVFNPYVTSRQLENNERCANGQATASGNSVARPVDHALGYAYCVRDEMEQHVSSYAYLNSIGGVTLIELAGVVAYRGMRPDNTANVSALAVGGAAQYGVMQWLYKKPREAIYLSGTGALTCAIGEARIVLRTGEEMEHLRKSADDAYARLDAYEFAQNSGSTLATRIRDQMTGCDVKDGALQGYAQGLMAELDAAPDPQHRLRADRLRDRHQLLISTQSDTARQLENLTDDIRETVNRQLASLQPAPDELAALLSGLKLGSLVAPDAPAGKSGSAGDGSAQAAGVDPESMQRGRKQCDATRLRAAVDDGYRHFETSRRLEREAVSALDIYEAGLPSRRSAAVSTSLASRCPLVRFGAPEPLAIVFPGGQPDAIGKNASVEVVVVGGNAPHTVRMVSERPQKERPAVKTAAGDNDATNITITTTDDTKAGRYTFLVNDRLGASQTFQIEVSE